MYIIYICVCILFNRLNFSNWIHAEYLFTGYTDVPMTFQRFCAVSKLPLVFMIRYFLVSENASLVYQTIPHIQTKSSVDFGRCWLVKWTSVCCVAGIPIQSPRVSLVRLLRNSLRVVFLCHIKMMLKRGIASSSAEFSVLGFVN